VWGPVVTFSHRGDVQPQNMADIRRFFVLICHDHSTMHQIRARPSPHHTRPRCRGCNAGAPHARMRPSRAMVAPSPPNASSCRCGLRAPPIDRVIAGAGCVPLQSIASSPVRVASCPRTRPAPCPVRPCRAPPLASVRPSHRCAPSPRPCRAPPRAPRPCYRCERAPVPRPRPLPDLMPRAPRIGASVRPAPRPIGAPHRCARSHGIQPVCIVFWSLAESAESA
jgi:hypothetical protein